MCGLGVGVRGGYEVGRVHLYDKKTKGRQLQVICICSLTLDKWFSISTNAVGERT